MRIVGIINLDNYLLCDTRVRLINLLFFKIKNQNSPQNNYSRLYTYIPTANYGHLIIQ